ncbi:MAG TPA: LpqB family beta-propeller domain-containing protein, partial [Bryobacteraceae bacterium]|nr:LpqB family beta-propeller domain-containing protein [Bryobacteraceae bacterium]
MIGKRLAHFEIIGKLGEGGMGVVFEAIDHHLDRRVALKILPPEKLADAVRKERFIQEAKAASALNHSNIVTIYDISCADGIDYIAMELVPGRTLEETLARRRPRLPEALKWAEQIAGALAAAHAAGIVHRDLKPANVMITDSGAVKVLDFGLAKLTCQESPKEDEATRTQRVLTEEGTVVGSAPYMSPEQAEGCKLDARSDIFSFGAVLFEMLSGKRAFGGDTRMATMSAILQKDAPPLGSVAPDIPREIERIVARCLRKDVARRSQSMAEIKLALEEIKEETESGATAATPAVAKRPQRNMLWIGMGAAALGAAALYFSLGVRSHADAPLAEVPLTSYTGFQGYPALSPDGSQFAFSWNGDQEGSRVQLYVSLAGRGTPVRLTNYPDKQARFPSWSPDGQAIAFAGGGRLLLIPALGGPERDLGPMAELPGTTGPGPPSWSPDGKMLYISTLSSDPGTFAVFVQPANGGERRQITDPPHGTRFGDLYPAVSPDGSKLAFVRKVGDYSEDLFVVDLAARAKAPRPLTNRQDLLRSPAWTPDGKEIVYAAGDSTNNAGIYRLRASGGVPVRLAGIGRDVQDLSLSRNGKRLAYSRDIRDYNIYRMAIPGPGTQAATETKFIASTRYEISPAYSPDGKRIAFSSNRNGSRQIWVADSDGSRAAPVTNFDRGYSGSPRWSPDGQTIVFDARPNGAADIYTVRADGGEPKQLTSNPAEDHVPCFSNDGRWIYFSSTRSGQREIYRMPAEGRPQVQVTHGGGYATLAADGKWLYYVKPGRPYRIWKAAVEGGEESVVVESGMTTPLNFAVAPSGIYFSDR